MLISGLLAYSQVARKADSPRQPVSIADVLETVQKNLRTTIDETQAEIVMSPLPVVCGDPVPLVHLFQNLLSNALKYRSAEPPRIRIDVAEDTLHWRFSVADNGIGIPKEFHTQVFGIFKRLHDRTQYPGTGIGLAICQKIVERYGGRIWVESGPEPGSKFIFTLPRAT
jgi:light-regulated signal transduction histidine kinase (bacteriophytochrome)